MIWPTAPIAKLSKVFGDGDWIESKDQSFDGIRLVQTGNVGEGNFKDRRDKARFISEATFDRLNCNEVLPGDVLISRLPDPVGRSCIIPETGDKMITAVDCTIVRPDLAKLEPTFLVYYTQTRAYLRDVEDRCTGTTRQRISRKHLGAISFPLPPLEEQKRIVEVLDKAFAALDRARALAEANLADAEELFSSAVDQLVSRNRQGWITGKFEEVVGDVKTGPFGSLLHKSDYVENHTPLVNPANIIDGRIVANAAKTVSHSALERLASYRMEAGDLVIGRRGEMGRCAAVAVNQAGWLCGTGSFFIRPKGGVLSELAAYMLRTRTVVEQLTSIATGATMLNLSNKALGAMEFAMPPKGKQSRMLDSINNFREISRIAQEGYLQKINGLDDLRQAILQKAFAGELTNSNIELVA